MNATATSANVALANGFEIRELTPSELEIVSGAGCSFRDFGEVAAAGAAVGGATLGLGGLVLGSFVGGIGAVPGAIGGTAIGVAVGGGGAVIGYAAGCFL